jgi:hypothetical protein
MTKNHLLMILCLSIIALVLVFVVAHKIEKKR